MNEPTKIIEVQNLKKSYGEVQAIQSIDFYVERGKLFAFLGPNGAGKSTTIDILCTLLAYNDGIVHIDGLQLGRDDAKIRQMIGVVFQNNILDPLLTVRENLYTRGSFYSLSKQEIQQAIQRAADFTGIVNFIDRPYGKLSGGQKRRSDIARALINTPRILFLDEPTTGLDPQTRKNIWETIRRMQLQTKMTVFLTTHYMEEAALADYVVIIDHGKIAARGTPADLRQQYSSDMLKLRGDHGRLKERLESLSASYQALGNELIVKLGNTMDAIPIIQACKADMTSFEVISGSMDDAFIEITGNEIRS